jgi:hypothetical protein
MTQALNLLASGLASIASVLVPTRGVSHTSTNYAYYFLPTNTPTQALAGDMLRVGAQIRIAQEEKKKLQQAEFGFVT